jgi:hypothetical protein
MLNVFEAIDFPPPPHWSQGRHVDVGSPVSLEYEQTAAPARIHGAAERIVLVVAVLDLIGLQCRSV